MSARPESAPLVAALPCHEPVAVVRDGHRTVVATGAVDELRIPGDRAQEAFAALDALDGSGGPGGPGGPGGGWWAGYLAYDLGRAIEAVVTRRAAETAPDLVLTRFAARVELAPGRAPRVLGTGPGRRALERALPDALAAPARLGEPAPSATWTTSLDRDAYERGVHDVQDLIRAGECYQVNLTRRLTGPPLDPVALWAAVEVGNPAPHATFWRDGAGHALVSASPERFLRVEGDTVESRPIKGTATAASSLRASEKDRAENVMIVDLTRNDLGRVCVPGTITVPELCRVEDHPGLVHLVSTVRGRRHPGTGLGGLIRATFPPASVTGAPKPRVMQAIEDLEPVRRGVYCGAVGWYDADARRGDLAVAIRTFTCTPTATTLGVGAGITIDSDPAAEWAETELKAARLMRLAGERRPPASALLARPATRVPNERSNRARTGSERALESGPNGPDPRVGSAGRVGSASGGGTA